MYHRQREQCKQRQGDMRQGRGFLKDILEKVEFMNENTGKLNSCIYLLVQETFIEHYHVQTTGEYKKRIFTSSSFQGTYCFIEEKGHSLYKLLPELQRISKRVWRKTNDFSLKEVIAEK